MTEILVTGSVGLVSSMVSAWISWILARRKYNSEVDGNIILNMKNSLEFYESLSDDNKQRLDKTLEDNAKFRETVENLRNENKQLKREIDVLKDQVIKITTTICTDLSCLIRSKDYSTLNIITNEKDTD